MEKRCSRCKEPKNIDEFHKCKRNRDGHLYACKECVSKYDIKRRDENKTHFRARGRYDSYLRMDKKKNYLIAVDFSFEQFMLRIENSECIYCGTTENLGLDRINNNAGHTRANTVVACYRDNSMRNNFFTIEEFKLFGPILKKIDLDRIKNKT